MGVCFSCDSDEGSGLPSAEDRKEGAIDDLVDELVDAPNGWRIAYRPNADNGAYLMLLNFDDNGTVTIHSDVVGGDGEDYFEQQIRYRIDASLGLELVFETYGVFHYLFEQQAATFGGEFVFTYLEEDNGNLFFASKSDIIDKTILELIPAQAGDVNLFSTELSERLGQYAGFTPQIFGGLPPIQHLALIDKGISVFWSIDALTRIITVDVAGVGITLEEVLLNDSYVSINHVTGYTMQNEKILLEEEFSFTINGENHTIKEVSLSNFDVETLSFCPTGIVEFPKATGSIAGLGSVVVSKSLFNSEGFNFTTKAETTYGINPFFIIDADGFSLLQSGSIGEKFPDAVSFVFNYGLEDVDQPTDAIGFIVLDDEGVPKTYLRALSSVVREGNKLVLEMSDNYYYSDTPGADDEQFLTDITDEIFEGGVVYLYDLPQDEGKVFWLYNPCNSYELFLVQ
jgi:hypothetical protein